MTNSLLSILTTDFVLYALAAGLALAAISGPMGSLVVWRRMSYFGDTLAHSALLGIAIGLITNSNPQLSIIITCLLFAFMLTLLDRRPSLSTDTLLGILAHSSLALGVVVLALADSIRVDLEAYLFGALLTISTTDLVWVLGIVLFVAVVFYKFWNDFLSITVHQELAEIEGINIAKMNLILLLLIALVIAVSMKIVGVLLITSLLIVPPAAARQLSKNPEEMAVKASIIGVISVVLGIFSSFYLDVPVGPTIVVVATVIFLLLYFRSGVQEPSKNT
ncbi:MAG: iron chelate uptake ABC transporter family permease subunit [Gammaproteobacteria bacterium]|jgi:zinc transport system permease protein|nr:iron chelate uptake ABC transporter family permease subunit [Gammaproteobacteria bacterium]MBT3861107.1 iron chelate uptake ABC transporter family permease subunit [Gammaproteobacteria bacterium]MBT3987683.1 iron chelate uptake ABC transporter family permease subunit [Gammaproteobacteria bacterium]MBT4254626.1 iron chelate uptake ABC transporter family permease subunit [Gammaproteobacteria bacterium]MBT4582737.1 iron chelate uptake ABC transporter family permease subunit [Gammaproteobacteria